MDKKAIITFLLALAAIAGQAQKKASAQKEVQQTVVGQISITAETPLNAQRKVTAHMTMDDYDGPIGIKLRGNSSLGNNQKKYTFELRDEDGHEVEAELMGMPAHSDWVLLGPYYDVSTVRDPLAFQLWRDMGHWGPRSRMVEVTLNGDYRGIYILCEAIKRGKDRVNIDKMRKADTSGRELTGGYLLRIDTANDDDATFPSKVPGVGEGNFMTQVTWSCIYPKKKKSLQPEQIAYIQNYIDTVEQVIQSDDFADPKTGYARYIDVPSFVDYFIHTELSLNADGYKRSAYFYKERQQPDGTGGKLFAGPVWDYNLAYGNAGFANADNPEAWNFEGASNNPTPAMWQRLLQDPAFRKAVKTRYQALRKNILSDKAIDAYIDRHVRLISPYLAHHFETYPELLVSEDEKKDGRPQSPFGGGGFPGFGGGGFPGFGGGGFPGFGGGDFPAMPDSIPQFGGGFPGFGGGGFPNFGGGGFPGFGEGGFPGFGGGGGMGFNPFGAYRVSSYEEEIKIVKDWLHNRLAFLDRNIERFDKDWEPRIQELKEIKAPQFGGFGDGGFPGFGGGFPGFGGFPM